MGLVRGYCPLPYNQWFCAVYQLQVECYVNLKYNYARYSFAVFFIIIKEKLFYLYNSQGQSQSSSLGLSMNRH